MRDQAIQMGVPSEAILIENDSLHTRENAEMVLALLKQYRMRRIILVTSPFHQQRTDLSPLCQSLPTTWDRDHQLLRRNWRMASGHLVPLFRVPETGEKRRGAHQNLPG